MCRPSGTRAHFAREKSLAVLGKFVYFLESRLFAKDGKTRNVQVWEALGISDEVVVAIQKFKKMRLPLAHPVCSHINVAAPLREEKEGIFQLVQQCRGAICQSTNLELTGGIERVELRGTTTLR